MADYKPNPGVAAVLSFVFNGLGQIYNGQIKKGLIIIAFSSLGMLLIVGGGILSFIWLWKGMLISRQLFISLLLLLLGIAVAVIVGIFGIFDAYNTAKRLNP